MAFVQIIEYTTTRSDEMEALMQEWKAQTEGRRTAQRETHTKDRDRPDTYVQVVEFPSYEAAMTNSKLPETSAIAERMAKLCDEPITFRNLDVLRVDQL
jgi:hypothetical protein